MQILAPAPSYILRVIGDDGTHYAIGDLTFGRARLLVGTDWQTGEDAW